MLLCQLIVALVMCCFSSALSIKNLTVIDYYNNQNVLVKYDTLGPDTVTDMQVKLIENEDQYQDLVISFQTDDVILKDAILLVGYPDSHQEVVYEIIEDNNKDTFVFAIKLQDFNRNLLALHDRLERKPMSVTFSASVEGDSDKIKKTLFYYVLKDSAILPYLADMEVVPRKEFAIKKEMAHTFNAPPTQAPAFIAQVFALVILATFGVLIVAWTSMGAYNFDNVPKGNSIYFVGFIGTIIGFEYIFAQYQFGTGIFETIYKAFCLGVPGIWICAKFLRSLDKPL